MTETQAATGAWLANLHFLTAEEARPMTGLWGAFFEKLPAKLVERVGRWLPSSDFGHGPFNDLAHQLPQDWPKGNSKRYDRVTQGTFEASALAVFNASGARALHAVNPFLQRLDVRHPLTIERVRVWPDRLQVE